MSQKNIQDIYPLSPTQKGILFHSLSAPESGVYVIQVSFILQGQLDWQRFEDTWQKLADQEDVLRTAFAWKNLEAPLQVVGKKVTIPTTLQDDSQHSATQQNAVFTQYKKQDRKIGFSLAKAPLMRIFCQKLSEDQHRVLCTYHHLLLDGWSLPLLLRSWRHIYLNGASAISNKGNFGQFVRWQQNQDRPAALNFWREYLADLNGPCQLAKPSSVNTSNNEIDNPETKTLNTSQQLACVIENAQLQNLRALANAHSLTLSTLVQGAWAILLSHYCNTGDVVFGVTRSGRPASLAHAAQTIGALITTLPVRSTLQGNADVLPWLKDLQRQLLQQQNYEFLGMADLREVSPLPIQQPIFDSIVVFENYPNEPSHANDALHLLNVEIQEQTHYPASLFAIAGEVLELKLLFDTSRLSLDMCQRLLNHVQHTLSHFERLVESPALTLNQFDLLPAGEKRRIATWLSESEAPVPNWTVDQKIAEVAGLTPSATAVIDQTGHTTYAELIDLSHRIATQLHEHGVQPGQRVAVCVQRDKSMVAALLAIMQTGAAYVPLDADYPVNRLQHMLEDSGAATVLCDHTTQQRLTFWQRAKLFVEDAQTITPAPPTVLKSHAHPTAPVYTIYTSGSSGLPKGVEISHRNLSNLLDAMATRLAFPTTSDLSATPEQQSTEHWLAVTTLSFDIAALELFLPLVNGATVVIANAQQSRDPASLNDLLNRYPITYMQATPSTWRLLVQNQWPGKQNLHVLSGGEALATELAETLLTHCKSLWNVYGPTETTIWSAAIKVNAPLLDKAVVPVGNPLANNQLYVLDTLQRPQAMGLVGELYIGGDGLSRGYVNRESLTRERFVNLPHICANTLYRTGDRVRLQANGTLEFLGRFDQQTKLRGFRIELEEIENQIRLVPEIIQSAVVIRQGDHQGEEQLMCFYQAELSNANIERKVRQQLVESLPHYMIPAAFYCLPELPKTPNGKLDRQALRDCVLPQSNAIMCNTPNSDLENKILSIWQDLLKHDKIGINDHFFEVGGHSLLILQMQTRLQNAFECDVPMVDLFARPTVASLAKYFSDENNKITTPVNTQGNTSQKPTGSTLNQRQKLAARRQQLSPRSNSISSSDSTSTKNTNSKNFSEV